MQYNLYNNLRVGEKVYSISNPKGLQFVFSDGMINQYNKDYIQFSAPISSGSSGGALLDNQGYLLGIITSQMNPSVYQNINFALPNKYFLSKINNNVIANYKNLNWTKFIIDNADKEQFKIYTNYAFNKKDFVMTKTGNCAGNDKKCTRLVGIELMDYLGQITTFNPGAELNF